MKRNIRSRMAAAQMRALAAVRRDIYARDRSGSCKYLRDFNNSYRSYDRILTVEELDQRIGSSTFLLIGDYHALPASQNFAAGLVERIAQSSKVVLGVEAVLCRDQRHLDSWWRREIDENELRQRLRFDREWGYDWQPFYELLVCAREHSEGIYSLDCMPRDDLRSIRSRDRHATEKICEMRERHPGAVIVVLFGESHMAPQHLPRLLGNVLPQERTLAILQNLDWLYWDAVKRQAPAVSLSDDAVCVFNSSPLEKYESYRLCLERWNMAPADDPADFAPAVHNMILSLARSLGFRLDSPHNGTQPKFLTDSLPDVVTSNADVPRENQPGERNCEYVPASNTILIREFQMFAAAREAARFLHYACAGKLHQRPTLIEAATKAPAETEDTLAYFGARLLCPGGADDTANSSGERMYESYLAGFISRCEVRRLFLGR